LNFKVRRTRVFATFSHYRSIYRLSGARICGTACPDASRTGERRGLAGTIHHFMVSHQRLQRDHRIQLAGQLFIELRTDNPSEFDERPDDVRCGEWPREWLYATRQRAIFQLHPLAFRK
jgi:hypothetical protein